MSHFQKFYSIQTKFKVELEPVIGLAIPIICKDFK